MARYADGLIAEGEHILLRTRQHWFSIVAYTVAFWILVAISVGFAGASQFSRAFRKITGTTPSSWRSKAVETHSLLLADPQ